MSCHSCLGLLHMAVLRYPLKLLLNVSFAANIHRLLLTWMCHHRNALEGATSWPGDQISCRLAPQAAEGGCVAVLPCLCSVK